MFCLTQYSIENSNNKNLFGKLFDNYIFIFTKDLLRVSESIKIKTKNLVSNAK